MTSISVVIPTRNRHRFLTEALSSVLAQNHPALEILVIDDGEGAEAAVGHMHGSIMVCNNRQRGPVAARNLGIVQAKADCILFLDDDDWFTDPRYFARVAAAFAGGAHFCYCDGTMAFMDGRPALPFAFHADGDTLTRDNTILVSGVVYRRALHDALGPFDEALPFYWDWDWYLRVARGGHSLTHIRGPAVAIRVHAQNMSGESLERQRRANLDLLEAKHRLPPIALKNHLDIATRPPGK